MKQLTEDYRIDELIELLPMLMKVKSTKKVTPECEALFGKEAYHPVKMLQFI